jgi:hypothetical protein
VIVFARCLTKIFSVSTVVTPMARGQPASASATSVHVAIITFVQSSEFKDPSTLITPSATPVPRPTTFCIGALDAIAFRYYRNLHCSLL